MAVEGPRRDRTFRIGALVGLFLAVGFAAALCGYRAAGIAPEPIPTPAPSATATVAPVRATPTPISELQSILRRADDLLDTANGSEKAIELLLPLLDSVENVEDLAKIYSLLLDAESQLGHFQLAAAYAEKLLELEPTTLNRYKLALLYDLGGDLENAYSQYSTLYWAADPKADEFRDYAKQRMDHIAQVLYTPTPTQVR